MVQVDPAGQTYRIVLGKSADIRIVIAEQIVVQSRFPIQVLPLQAQVLGIIQILLIFLILYAAPGAAVTLPAQRSVAVGQAFRFAVRRRVEVKYLGRRVAVDARQRFIAALIGIDIGEGHAVASFLQQPETFPQKRGGLAFAGRLAQILTLLPHPLLRAPPERIIVELHMLLGFAAMLAVAHHLAEAMIGVVEILPTVVAFAFFHRAAKDIVSVINSLIMQYAVVPLAELPLIQQVGCRIVPVALGIRQRAVPAQQSTGGIVLITLVGERVGVVFFAVRLF